MRELTYPFDSEYILKKSKRIKKELLASDEKRVQKKIAVLGGSTTHDIIRVLELFLLDQGIEPVFYESEYAMYWQDAMFGTDKLKEFGPDIIFIHTSNRNITDYPEMNDAKEAVAYNDEKDAAFYAFDGTETKIDLKEKMFAIYFPEDAHLPNYENGKNENCLKVIVKCRV